MALPKIKHPTYKLNIPSSNKQVTFRPFTVKEEKILLMAQSTGETSDSLDAIKQIINNCVLDEIDVNSLAVFDIEYIFIQLRSKSVGEEVEILYKDGEEDVKFKVNLNDVKVKFNPLHKNKFIVHKNIGLIMRYPSLEEVKLVNSSEELDNDKTFEILTKCIDKVFDDDKIYDQFSKEEINEFILSLPMESIEGIKTFFDTMPSVEHDVVIKNKEGGVKTITLKGINSFFPF